MPNKKIQRKRQESALALLLVAFVLALGTIGYSMIEGWDLFDSFYMTVITLATIGYGETHPLTTEGRAFTIILIFAGVGIGTVVIGSVGRNLIEGQISRILDRRHKVQEMLLDLTKHTIFCGYSRLGRMAAKELRQKGHDVVIVENDPARADDAEEAGFLVVRGDATIDETLVSAGVTRAERLISLLPRDSDNLYVILTGREMNASLYIVSRAEDEVGEKRLRRAGVDRLISTHRLAARKLADGLLRPYVTDFFEIAGTSADGWRIEEIKVPEGSPISGKTLRDLSLRQRANVSIAAVVLPSGELVLNPDGEATVSSGSTLIVIGWKKDISTLEEMVLSV
jgi:voltage-gated potassium channel